MKNVFWLIADEIAGRTGPNQDPWDPLELAAGGIGAILSVNGGEMVDRQAMERADIRYAETLRVVGTITDKTVADGEHRVHLDVNVLNDQGDATCPGRAVVVLPARGAAS